MEKLYKFSGRGEMSVAQALTASIGSDVNDALQEALSDAIAGSVDDIVRRATKRCVEAYFTEVTERPQPKLPETLFQWLDEVQSRFEMPDIVKVLMEIDGGPDDFMVLAQRVFKEWTGEDFKTVREAKMDEATIGTIVNGLEWGPRGDHTVSWEVACRIAGTQDGWRLPTFTELMTLLDFESGQNPLKETLTLWSATVMDEDRAFCVDFNCPNGRSAKKTSNNWVRLVRPVKGDK